MRSCVCTARRRRGGMGLFLLAAAGALTGTGRSAVAQVQPGSITVSLREVASGLSAPVLLTHAGDGSGRLFIVDQAGLIRIVDASGNLLSTPFLDLRAAIPPLNAGFDERGLLGLAFHPDYEHNGRFFVRRSGPRAGAPGEPCFGTSRGCHEEILSEFHVSAGDPNVANPAETILFRVNKPQFNHNSGGIEFGPDGTLYFTLGDGGGGGDGLNTNPPTHGPIGNAQNINVPLGKVLRIDVDSGAPYGIPADNPFVGTDGLDEVYAYGLRNPYRFSFDNGPGGDNRLILGDVGQGLTEEVDIIVNGGNYGWVIMEGTHCFDPHAFNTPPATCNNAGMIPPIAEYSHADGIAVIGGYIYRGAGIPELFGKYVLGDFTLNFAAPSGQLYYLDPGQGERGLATIFEFRLGGRNDPLGRFLFGLGEDQDGELYALTNGQAGPIGTQGRVFRLVRSCAADWNGLEGLDSQDFFDFLEDFFNGDADFNGFDGTDSQDYFDFLEGFFGGCVS